MTIDELIEAAKANPGERIEMELADRVFCAVFHVERPAIYMDGKRTPMSVAKAGLLTLERRTGQKAVRCSPGVIRSLNDLKAKARLSGSASIVVGEHTFTAVSTDVGLNDYVLFDGKRIPKAQLDGLFEAYLRIERSKQR